MNFHSVGFNSFLFCLLYIIHIPRFFFLPSFEMNAIIVHDVRYSISNSSDCSPFMIQ